MRYFSIKQPSPFEKGYNILL